MTDGDAQRLTVIPPAPDGRSLHRDSLETKINLGWRFGWRDGFEDDALAEAPVVECGALSGEIQTVGAERAVVPEEVLQLDRAHHLGRVDELEQVALERAEPLLRREALGIRSVELLF